MSKNVQQILQSNKLSHESHEKQENGITCKKKNTFAEVTIQRSFF